MIENLRHDLTRKEIFKFLKSYQNGENDKNRNKNQNKSKNTNRKECIRVKHIYLFQNMENTVPGYCFIDFLIEKMQVLRKLFYI